MGSVRFSKKWFNPLYFILNDVIRDTSIRIVLIYGGKSSSKTVTVCQQFSKEAVVHKHSSISFRKESTIIKTTLKKSFELAMKKMYLDPAFIKLDFIFKTNDAEIVMKGLDDEEKAKGIESYKYLYLDELNHFLPGEFEQFDLALRGIAGQKIFASWNPVDENSWVKTDLVDKYTFKDTKWKLPSENSFVRISTCGKVVLIKTTYHDNFWIVGSPDGKYGFRDQNLIDTYEALRAKNYNSYKVNVLGEWGKTVFGGEILKKWRSEHHITEDGYNPKLPLHLSFDENVNPYFPCGFFQVDDNQTDVTLVDCLAMKNPDNTVKSMCREIVRKLMAWGYDKSFPICIYGDATSDKEDVKQEKGHDLFRLIEIELKAAGYVVRRKVDKSNPSVLTSMSFFNSILEEDIGLKFRVNKKCRPAIVDYENTKEDKNGKIDKKTVTDPVTRVAYQPYGHFIDLSRYFLCSAFSREYSEFQLGHRSVKIRTGKNVHKHSY